MSKPDWGKIADAVEGTTMGVPEIAERFDVDEDDVEEELDNVGIEHCLGCDWWVETALLMLNDYGDMVCSDCA